MLNLLAHSIILGLFIEISFNSNINCWSVSAPANEKFLKSKFLLILYISSGQEDDCWCSH
jgi:hypothetical protein